MEFTATNLTLTSNPEMFKSMVKVNVSRPIWKKTDGKWEHVGDDTYEMVAFGDVATSLMMEAEGVVIDVKGRVKTRQFEAKTGKVYTNYNFIINEYTHNTDD